MTGYSEPFQLKLIDAKLRANDLEALPHSPIYAMHKFWARRPWNVFRSIIETYTQPGDIVLDPFCGGGTTVVESLILRRKAIGVDINPLAIYITDMEIKPFSRREFQEAYYTVERTVSAILNETYTTHCPVCGKKSEIDWAEWDEHNHSILRIKGICPECGTFTKTPDNFDHQLALMYEQKFNELARNYSLWFPTERIPDGDKTKEMLKRGIETFSDLFTKRNLFALAVLYKAIKDLPPDSGRDFALFAFSALLKWASRMSRLRGDTIDGWAMHAYWIYPKSLEMNVWRLFRRRYQAILRGKSFSENVIGGWNIRVKNFDELVNGFGHYMLLNQSADSLPLPSNSVDAVITDPPYGGNVNYGELSDYFLVWHDGCVMDKRKEIIINKTQGKTLSDYYEGLKGVFHECARVLKPKRPMVFTFNSKDVRVVTVAILAASQAGFTLDVNNVFYQKPTRLYETTFHGMFPDALLGDFVLPFWRDVSPITSKPNPKEVVSQVSEIIEETIRNGGLEKVARQRVYQILLPFLGNYSHAFPDVCLDVAENVERIFRQTSEIFKQRRQQFIQQRRNKYLEVRKVRRHYGAEEEY